MTRTAVLCVALAAAGCFKGEADKGKCSSAADCVVGANCDPGLHVCVYSCPSLCATGSECVNGSCIQTVCIPSCTTNQTCDTTQVPPACVGLQSGVASVTRPAAADVVGGPAVIVSATAGAPDPGPTKVVFRLEQSGVSKATATATTGIQGVYTATMQLGAGVATGAGNVIAAVYWNKNGSEVSVDSAPVAVTVDESAPSITTPATDAPFYSSTAAGAPPNAVVSIAINDVGGAGVDKTTAHLGVPGHSYPAATTPAAAGGGGTYTFAVPVADLGIGAGAQGPVVYLVTASDKVGNAQAFDGGSIAVDNEPPTITNVTADTADWFDGGGAIAVTADVSDPAGGSGLNAGTVKILLADNVTTVDPVSVAGATRSWNPTGATFQANGQQGPVNFHITAKDNVNNAQSNGPITVKVDRRAPSVGTVAVTDNPLANSNGYYPRDAAIAVPVSVPVDDSPDAVPGSGAATATLTAGAGNTAATAAGSTTTGTVKTFNFTVPTTAQTAGSEGAVALSVTAADGVGNTTVVTPTATVKVDDKPPTLVSVGIDSSMTIRFTDANGVAWFNQSDSGTIKITATITDAGAGVLMSSLKLVKHGTTTQIDNGTIGHTAGTNLYTFNVARSGGPIAAGAEGVVAYDVAAADGLSPVSPTNHTRAAPATADGKLGIDGAPPSSFTFTVTYPPAGTDCDKTLPGGGADNGIVCGHDGSHWWRRGLGAGGVETTSMSFSATDNGAGMDPTAGTCAITGSSKTCTPSSTNTKGDPTATYTFTPNFTDATLGTLDTKTGGSTATITVNAADAVGNVATAGTPANTVQTAAVSRIRWIQKLSNEGLASLAGAPIASNSQIIVGGTSASNDPIIGLKPTGGVLWTGGRAAGLTAVTNNMAYDGSAAILYVLTAHTLYALHVAAPSVDKYATQGLTSSLGSPVIYTPGATGVVLATDTGTTPPRIDSLTPSLLTTGGTFTLNDFARLSTKTSASIGPPTVWTDGTIYWTYDNSATVAGDAGVATSMFASGSFSTPAAHILDTGIPAFINSYTYIALADALFFGNSSNKLYYDYSFAFAQNWNAGSAKGAAFSSTKNAANPLVVSKGVVLGASVAKAQLYAYDKSTGTFKWTYPSSTSTDLSTISSPVTAPDGMIYFSDSANSELVAVNSSGALQWNFLGPTNLTLGGAATEAAIDSSGIIYFGQGSNLYALITDVGTSAPAVGADWNRSGFDNCNSSNAGFSCPQ